MLGCSRHRSTSSAASWGVKRFPGSLGFVTTLRKAATVCPGNPIGTPLEKICSIQARALAWCSELASYAYRRIFASRTITCALCLLSPRSSPPRCRSLTPEANPMPGDEPRTACDPAFRKPSNPAEESGSPRPSGKRQIGESHRVSGQISLAGSPRPRTHSLSPRHSDAAGMGTASGPDGIQRCLRRASQTARCLSGNQ
jgi:hypothetical protein